MYILKKSKRALGLNEPIKDNHGKPVTRREMIARGFMTGPAVIAAPSILAMMLGSTRPTVSVVAGTLHKAGLIKYTHGRITILDRQGLEAASCECYATVKAHFDRLGL